MTRRVIAVVLVGLSVAGCIGFTGDPTVAPATATPARSPAQSPTPAPSDPPVELTIFAAASLRDVLDRMKPAYETEHPGATLTISTDSSAALASQIELGAPADIFLSADTTTAERLVAEGLASEDVAYFAGTTLVIVTPLDDPGGIGGPFDLAKPGVRVIAAGDAVPITGYADAVVANLAAAPGAPAGFASRYAANIVSRESNVKAVLAKIELGEGDAGFVYATDAHASTKVRVVEVPPEHNRWAIYAGTVVTASARQRQAATFVDWLRGREAGAFLVEAGFFIPPA